MDIKKAAADLRLKKMTEAGDAYFATLDNAAHKAFAALHLDWLMDHQAGHQPRPEEGMSESDAAAIRAKLNDIHHAAAP